MLYGSFYSFDSMLEEDKPYIIWEGVLLALFCFLFSQTSSLWRCLLLIPVRVLLLVWAGVEGLFSTVLLLLFSLIFIGGLMVILVRVASVSQQEQKVGVRAAGLFFLFCALFFTEESSSREKGFFFFFYDLIRRFLGYIYFVTLLLVISLLVISHFLMNIKGIARNI